MADVSVSVRPAPPKMNVVNSNSDIVDLWPTAVAPQRAPPDPTMMEKLVQDLQVRQYGTAKSSVNFLSKSNVI